MADNAQEIAAVKAEIAGYKQDLKGATTDAAKDRYAGLINSHITRLTALEARAQPGKSLSLPLHFTLSSFCVPNSSSCSIFALATSTLRACLL